MKLNITEVHFVKQAIGSVSIKAADASFVSELMVKLDKEFERLQKIEEKKSEDLEVVSK
jgi:hypothetical protein